MIDIAQAAGDQNNDFATIPDVSVDAIATRTLPREVTTGVNRGTQTIMNTDGSYITLGLIPDGSNTFGIAFFDRSGNLISKNTGVTQFVYDPTANKNVMQIGKLPDSTYGFAVATTGNNVADGFN